MEPIIELRSEMHVRPWAKYRIGLFILISPWILIGIGFGIGYWIGSPRLISSELNRQAAQNVAYDVFKECDKQFIPHGKSLWATELANEKCQKLFNIALDSGYRAREKKK